MHPTSLFLFLFFPLLLSAQISQPRMSASNVSNLHTAPEGVNASDGVYDKFVLIRWEASNLNSNFRLFRAKSSSGASMLELTKSWQKSTWFCDYSAEKGQDYYYAVLGSDGKTSSPLSRFDKGFLKKEDKIAHDESLSYNTPDKYAAGKQIFVLVSEVNTDTSSYSLGAQARLNIGLQNIFDDPTPTTHLRVYLSLDNVWDFDDTLLLSKAYSGFPATIKVALSETVQLPDNVLPGAYNLLVVATTEGNILQSKTGSTTINILGK